MGKYFCDYCDVFLTHDSASVRRAHNAGRNHLTNVKDYYSSLGNDQAQDMIDSITRMYESGNAPDRPFPNAPTGMSGNFTMNAPPGMMMGGGSMNGMGGGMNPPMRMGGPPQQNGFNPPQFIPGGAPMHFGQNNNQQHQQGPPQFFNGAQPPMPSGFRPPPGMGGPPPGMGQPQSGFNQSAGPSQPPPPSTAKLVNGFSAERAKMLGLL